MRQVFLVVALLAGASSAQPSKQPEPRQAEATGAEQHQPPTQPAIQVTVTAQEKTAAEKQADTDRANRQDATNDRIAEANDRMATFTFYLAILGGIQLLATIAAFGVAMRSANAAKRSADIARNALVLTQRGRLSVESVQVKAPRQFDDSTPPKIKIGVAVIFRNVGPTMVNVVESRFDYGAGHPDQLPDAWEFASPTKTESFPVAQGDTFEQHKWLEFADIAALERFKDGKNVLFLCGYAKYRDIIDPEYIHTTQYARVHNPARKLVRAITKPGYNYAD